MESQRELLIRFLKDRRARIAPSELGLPEAVRRRTPGLRREDVAAIAGVSVTWYTWLEQGRDIRVSEQVLEKVASALRLDADEREYLFMLTQHRPPSPVHTSEEFPEISETLQRMIDSVGTPAIVITERWDVLGWNSLYTAVFRDYAKIEQSERNLLKVLFIREAGRLDAQQFEAMANRVVPKFRVDYSQSANPASFDGLVQELSDASPTFKRLWDCPELATRSVGVHTVERPGLRPMTFEHSSYVPEGSPQLRVIIYSPHDEHCASAIAEVAGASAPG